MSRYFKYTISILNFFITLSFSFIANSDQSSPQDKKLIYESAKEMKYDSISTGRPSTRHTSIIKILESPALLAFGISKTIILSSDPNELCDRLR